MHEMMLDETGGDIWNIANQEEFEEAWIEWFKRKIPFKYKLKPAPPSDLMKQDMDYRK